jgi:RNA polymerase sigma factor (sigma-70 family)
MSSLLQHFPSDEKLSKAVAAGDEAAFEELYRRYARPLAGYGARVLRDRSRGEDVAQTALMRAYDALRRGTEPLRVKPWLYKIALNTALELRAKSGEVLDGESEEVEDTSLDMRAQRADLLVGVEGLPERQRKVFVLRELQGLPVGEVARALGLSNQQVEQALFAARNRLAEVLVFGERLDCETVRTLDRSQLTHYERRALKSHVRSCASCKRQAGFGLSTIGFWLRDAWTWFVGGGATVAKVGAVAMTATVVTAAPDVVPVLPNGSIPRSEAAVVERAEVAATTRAVAKFEHAARVSARAPARSAVGAVARAVAVIPSVAADPDSVAGLPVLAEEEVVSEEALGPTAQPAEARDEPPPSPPEPQPRPDESRPEEPPGEPELMPLENSEPVDAPVDEPAPRGESEPETDEAPANNLNVP